MDEQQLQAKIAEAKAAGYTDAEIQSHLNDMRGTPTPLEAPEQNKHHEANVGAAELGLAKGAEYALEFGLPAAGAYKLAKGFMNRPAPVAPGYSPNIPASGGGVPYRAPVSSFDAGGQKVADFVRGGAPNGAPIGPGQASAPVAPPNTTVAQQPPTAQNFIQRIAELSSRYAPAVRGGAGVAAAVMPGNVGQNYPFPQSGPMRGQEINPQTGRPWTQMELARYNQQQ